MWLHKLSTATLRVVAAAKLHESQLGELPSAGLVLQLAEAEPGANPRAALIVVREEILTDDGCYVVPLRRRRKLDPPVTVPDLETLWAIAATGKTPRCKLWQPGGGRLPGQHLDWLAQRWEEWSRDPERLQTMSEPLRSVLEAAEGNRRAAAASE